MITSVGYLLQAAKNPLIQYEGKMSPHQQVYNTSQARKRFLRAANKIGKTYAGAAEAWWHLLDYHPYRQTMGIGTTGIVLCPDLTSGWVTISEALRELEPPNVLDKHTLYSEGVGYTYRGRKSIKIHDDLGGAVLHGRGCEQNVLALEGIRAQWAWVDEPPKKQHFDALRARIAMDSGPIWVTLTPVSRPVGWLREIVAGTSDGKPPLEPDWHEVVADLRLENAPFRTPESIRQQIEEAPEEERPQRINASWEGISNARRIPGFTDNNIYKGDLTQLPKFSKFGLGFDHGEKPGSSVCIFVTYEPKKKAIWIMDEWYSERRMSIHDEAIAVRDMLLKWGIRLHEIDTAVGDTNSAGAAASGATINQLLEQEFRRLNRGHTPFNMDRAYKPAGSIMSRSVMLSSLAKMNRLHVLQDCKSIINSLRYWEGKNDDLKHSIDALGYIIYPWTKYDQNDTVAKWRI